ncbi:hypothetical protein V1524DRAFT_475665 [Lipomyces starkeyi]
MSTNPPHHPDFHSVVRGLTDHVTFFLTADFVGPTPLTGTVGTDGTATPIPATPVCFTFAGTSPTFPPGFTTTVAAGGASFTSALVDVTATGAGALVVETSPASSCCPTQAILPFANFGPTAATTICATPGASGFPTSCPQVILGSATFTLGATYTANAITVRAQPHLLPQPQYPP